MAKARGRPGVSALPNLQLLVMSGCAGSTVPVEAVAATLPLLPRSCKILRRDAVLGKDSRTALQDIEAVADHCTGPGSGGLCAWPPGAWLMHEMWPAADACTQGLLERVVRFGFGFLQPFQRDGLLDVG